MTERFQRRLADVIRRPLITEKATRALEINQYTFEVDHRAAKPESKPSAMARSLIGIVTCKRNHANDELLDILT